MSRKALCRRFCLSITHLPNQLITRSPDHGGHPIFFWLDAKISPMRLRPLLLSLLISSSVFAQDSIGKLLQEAETAPTLEKNLRTLTDEIGGRVPGTPAMERAVQWGVDAFKAAGADNVRTEPVRLAASWEEGNTQVDVVSPVQFHVRAVSLTWTAPSSSPAQGLLVVDVGAGSGEDFKKAANLK